jgi:hypothetical protein
VYLDVFGKPIVIISSLEVAKELLDKRSSIYSDRPELVCLNQRRLGLKKSADELFRLWPICELASSVIFPNTL